MSVLLYSWPDGSSVSASASEQPKPVRDGSPADYVVLSVELSGLVGKQIRLSVHSPGEVSSQVESLSACCYDLSLRRKVTGFLLDLGAVRRPVRGSTGMVAAGTGALLDYPCWVPDEAWARRYDVGRQRQGTVPGPLIGVVENFSVAHRSGSYVGTWGGSRREGRGWGWSSPEKRTGDHRSVEAVVDEVLKREIVLPESYRELWEPSNVERGTWVRPAPDEVELYGCLGDPLPFFWGGRRFLEWLAEEGEDHLSTLSFQQAESVLS